MVIPMNELDAILIEQKQAAEKRLQADKLKRVAGGLYDAGNGWAVKDLEYNHSPLGLSATKLLSPEQVCEKHKRQYGKTITVDMLQYWTKRGNFPLPRSINGVIGWDANTATAGLNNLSKVSGRGFTSLRRGACK